MKQNKSTSKIKQIESNTKNSDNKIKEVRSVSVTKEFKLTNEKVINIIFLTYENFKTWLKIFDKLVDNKA